MYFEADHVFHVYNRGNNKVKIFFNDRNYLFFLKKVRAEWQRYSDILGYCLMPNHFHFMIQPKPEGCKTMVLGGQASHLQVLSKTIGKTLSSYTQAINLQNNTTGNLFQKKTKSKCLTVDSFARPGLVEQEYLVNCFHYIHQNPIAAGLVKKLEEWPYSSWPDYYGFRNGSLCNREIIMTRGGLSIPDFNPSNKIVVNDELVKGIW